MALSRIFWEKVDMHFVIGQGFEPGIHCLSLSLVVADGLY